MPRVAQAARPRRRAPAKAANLPPLPPEWADDGDAIVAAFGLARRDLLLVLIFAPHQTDARGRPLSGCDLLWQYVHGHGPAAIADGRPGVALPRQA